jgi:hypothetical protein
MSANFLDVSGAGVGVDNHLYVTAKGPVPVPVPKTPHLVGSKHAWGSKTWRIAKTVTTCGRPVLQSSWAMLVVPHLPLTVQPPHPLAEGINIAAIVLTSSSTPLMSVHSVTGEGLALETAVYGLFGINIDCGDIPLPGAMADFNGNTVKTSPTLGDYLSSLFAAFCAVGYAWAVGAIISDKINPAGELAKILERSLASLGVAIVQTLLDILAAAVSPLADSINYAINWIAAKIQALLDSPNTAPALGQ